MVPMLCRPPFDNQLKKMLSDFQHYFSGVQTGTVFPVLLSVSHHSLGVVCSIYQKPGVHPGPAGPTDSTWSSPY